MANPTKRVWDRRLRKVLAQLRSRGWSAEDGSKHLLVRSPDGSVMLPMPRDTEHRAILNWRSQTKHRLLAHGMQAEADIIDNEFRK